MNPVLVELPNEVQKIQAFREGVSHPGWHAPVTLILEDSFVVINSENGNLLRSFQLPADRSKIVDCKYITSEKSFLVATEDSYLVLIPDSSKGTADYVQQQWPVRIKELVIIGDKSIAVVSENELSCVRVEQSRISVPNYAGSKVGKKNTGNSSPPYLRKVFSSCGKLIRLTAQTKIGVQLQLWNDPLPSGSISSILSEETVSSQRILEELRLESEEIRFFIVDSQKQSLHCIVNVKSTDSYKGNKHASTNKTQGSRWLKFDLFGKLLFERQLSFVPTFYSLRSDRLWLLNDAQELTTWSARYGTLLQTLTVTAPIATQLCDLVHLDGDHGNHSLLYGLTNKDGQATTIFRYDVGGVSTSPVSLSALVGSQGKRSHQELVSSSSSYTSGSTTVASPSMYYEVLREELDGDKISEYFLQDKNKRRKLSQLLPLTSAQVQSILSKYSNEIIASSSSSSSSILSLSTAEWMELLMVIRLGVFSVQRHSAVWHAAIAHQRLDVLTEMIRFAADINEFQVVEALQVVLAMEEESLSEYAIFGGNIVSNTTKDTVMQLLTPEDKNLWLVSSKEAGAGKENNEEDNENSRKKSKKSKKDKEKADDVTPAPAVLQSRVQVVRAVVESVLYRVPRFSPVIVSEALQRISVSSASLLLRMLVFAAADMTTVPRSIQPRHVFPFLGTPQLLGAIEWMEAIIDSHFSSFLFEAESSHDLKRCLQHLVHLVQNTDDSIQAVEELRGLWSDIERSLTRKGVQPRVDPGLYTVEILRL